MTAIRPAKPGDADSIARVHVAAWRTTYRGILADSYLDSLSVEERAAGWRGLLVNPDQFTLVAEVEGEVVGFANGGPERSGHYGFEGQLYALYLLSEFRGRGIGRKLFRHTATTSLDRETDGMLVFCLEQNPYRRFYERMGGEFVCRRTIRIGGRSFDEVAYGWRELPAVVPAEDSG